MGEGKLKTAVMGLDESSRSLLEGASQSDYFEIEAVADKDIKAAGKAAEEYNCAAYDDYRQLIMQNEFDCLLVAAGPMSFDEYVRAAIKKKTNVLKAPPPARNFEEAAYLVRLAEEENVKLAAANPGRFARSFVSLRQLVQEGRAGQISLITAVCNGGNQPYAAWQADPKLAGGGVLLHNCYEIIDQILWNFDVPQQVFALSASSAGDKKQRLYLTEDAAVVTMKFSDTCFGSITASRRVGIGQEEELLQICGKDKTVTVSDTHLTVRDSDGRIEEEYEYTDDEHARVAKVLENFAMSIVAPDNNRLISGGRENMKNMAVIEAAYLSARTGMPEEPARILEMARIEPTNIWPDDKKQ
ncbi:MAG: Gfo/Idh/MocA family protein [Planctomycetota bacterium]|jgi:predicted dehydrogenase